MAEVFGNTGKTLTGVDKGNNFVQGIRQSVVDEYTEWNRLRKLRQEQKALKKQGKLDVRTEEVPFSPLEVNGVNILDDLYEQGKKTADTTSDVGEQVAKEVIDAEDALAGARVVDDPVKDASAAKEKFEEAGDLPSVNKRARDELKPARDGWFAKTKTKSPEIDFAAVKTSQLSDDIARWYNGATSDPTDPEVIRAYQKLSEEVDEQYKYMTEDLGIKVEFTDTDPYMRTLDDGRVVPDSAAMMADVLENKTLKVFRTAEDQTHPILSKDANDKFRAVHDFFGHASSGRGFAADGEEAAWISHSLMFSPLARRAMTSETRGQNSWVNKYGVDENGNVVFAEQKATLAPEEFVLTPDEFTQYADKLEAGNSFIGLNAKYQLDLSDDLLYDLGRVYTPYASKKQYTAKELSEIESSLPQFNGENFAAKDAVTVQAVKFMDKLRDLLAEPFSKNYSSAFQGEPAEGLSINSLLEFAEEAAGTGARTSDETTALAAMQKVLDEHIDMTELIEQGMKVEGRALGAPEPFKPTFWGTRSGNLDTAVDVKVVAGTSIRPFQYTYGKPPFSEATLRRYFPDDELLTDERNLGIAMGTADAKSIGVRLEKGQSLSKSEAAGFRQEALWSSFRARNAERIKEVQELERLDWVSKNSIPASELFHVYENGTIIGAGNLPSFIPPGAVQTIDGKAVSTLGKILGNLGKVVERGQGVTPRLDINQVARFDEAGKATGLVPLKDSPARRYLRKRLKGVNKELSLDTYPAELQAFLLTKMDEVIETAQKNGVSRPLQKTQSVDELAVTIYEKIPAVKSMQDAQILARGGSKALKELQKKPGRKYYIPGAKQNAYEAADILTLTRATPAAGKRSFANEVTRDPESGVPLNADGLPVAPSKAATKQPTQQRYNLLDEKGGTYTGRNGQRLAGVRAAKEAIENIVKDISSDKLVADRGQAQLLSSVMTRLGIEVSPSATPAQVFKMFKENAPQRFDEVLQNIQSAARYDSVVAHAPELFRGAIDEQLTLVEAIQRTDLGDLQLATVKFTEDALDLIDDFCRAKGPGI